MRQQQFSVLLAVVHWCVSEDLYCKTNATQTPLRLTDKLSLLAGDVVTFRMHIGGPEHGYIIPKVVGNTLDDECSIVSMTANAWDEKNAQFMLVPIAVIDEETIFQDVKDAGDLYSKPRQVSTVNQVHVSSGRVLGLTTCRNPNQSGSNVKCVKNTPVQLPTKFTHPCLSVMSDFNTVWDVDAHDQPEEAYQRLVYNSTGVDLAPVRGSKVQDDIPIVMLSNPNTFIPFSIGSSQVKDDVNNAEDLFTRPCRINVPKMGATWLREFLLSSDGQDTLRRFSLCVDKANAFTSLDKLIDPSFYNNDNDTNVVTSLWKEVAEQRQWRSDENIRAEELIKQVKQAQQGYIGIDCTTCTPLLMEEVHKELFENAADFSHEDEKDMQLHVTREMQKSTDADTLTFLSAQLFNKKHRIVKTMQNQNEVEVNLNGIPVEPVPIPVSSPAEAKMNSYLSGLNVGEPQFKMLDQFGLGVMQEGLQQTPLGGMMRGENATMPDMQAGAQTWGTNQLKNLADKPVGLHQFQADYIYNTSNQGGDDIQPPKPTIVQPDSTAFVTIKSRPTGAGPAILHVPCSSVISMQNTDPSINTQAVKPANIFSSPKQEEQAGKVQTHLFQSLRSAVPMSMTGSIQSHNVHMRDGAKIGSDEDIQNSRFPPSHFGMSQQTSRGKKMRTFQAATGSCTLRVIRLDGEPVVECMASSPCATPTVQETNALWAIARVPFNDVPTSSQFLSENLSGVSFAQQNAKVDVFPFTMGQQSVRNQTPVAQFCTSKVAKRQISSFTFQWGISLRPIFAVYIVAPDQLSQPITNALNGLISSVVGLIQQVFPNFPAFNPIPPDALDYLFRPFLSIDVLISFVGTHVVTSTSEVVQSYSLSAPGLTQVIGRQIGHFGRTSVPFVADIARVVRVPAGVYGNGNGHVVTLDYRAPGIYEAASLFSTEYLVDTL